MKFYIPTELYLKFVVSDYKFCKDTNNSQYAVFPINYAFKVFLKDEFEKILQQKIFDIQFVFKNSILFESVEKLTHEKQSNELKVEI